MGDKEKAHAAIGLAIKRRFIPPATELRCADCGEPARFYHHPNGYDEAHRYDELPRPAGEGA